MNDTQLSTEESLLHYEEMSLNAWPSLDTLVYKGCLLRLSQGYTKRANSANPLYSQPSDIADIVQYCEAVYASQGLPSIVKILETPAYAELDDFLDHQKYRKIAETHVMTVALEHARVHDASGVIIEHEFRDEWVAAFMRCNHVGRHAEIASRMLKRIRSKKYIASCVVDRQIVACGYGAVERGHVGCFDIVVDEAWRGHGFGRKIMDGLLCRAKDDEVASGYLQVIAANTAAINLYQSIGFQTRYDYWYRMKEQR